MKLIKNKINLLVIVIWAIGFFLRIYRQSALLGFYYDQGRDAKIAHDIISGTNFPAIGPTTGIQGLYLGPFWFYLITPGYLFGNGNPATASWFIAFLDSLTIPLIYIFLSKYAENKKAGIIGAILWSFSHYLIRSARWFSNPSPLPFFVLLIMIITLEIIQNKKYKYIPLLTLLLGLSLQLEAASAIFFFPILLVFFIINLKTIKKIPTKFWLQSVLSFGILLLPQIAFEIKNKFVITKTFFGFLTGKVNSDTGKSWAIPSLEFIGKRLIAYYQNLFSKLDTNVTPKSIILLIIFVFGTIYLIIKYRRVLSYQLNLLWLFIPLFLLLFFSGNYGNLYGYYLTGFFPAFIILFALIITSVNNLFLSGLLISITFIIFYLGTFIHLKNYLSAGTDGPEHITLGSELDAVKYICQLSKDKDYNLDIYVPPITPHSYEYLFAWQNRIGRCRQPTSEKQNVIHILYEVDPPSPERLKNWMVKYQNYPLVEKNGFGGVYVEIRRYPQK